MADVPVEENHFGIGRECRTVLGGPDAALDLGEKIAIERELWGECRHQFLALHLTPAISSINIVRKIVYSAKESLQRVTGNERQRGIFGF
jgi:hypothetical protein